MNKHEAIENINGLWSFAFEDGPHEAVTGGAFDEEVLQHVVLNDGDAGLQLFGVDEYLLHASTG